MRICNGCSEKTDSVLRCPRCPRGEESAYFCTQKCFAENYQAHSSKSHQGPNVTDKRLAQFRDFNEHFTGPLRPYSTTPSNVVPAHIPRPDYAATGRSRLEESSRGKPIKVYNEAEIKSMKASCKIARGALDLARDLCKIGTTGIQVDDAVHAYIIKHDAYPSPLNYYGFPKSCCVSVNEVVCHGIPDARPFANGDIVNVDITVFFEGMHADVNETFPIGDISEEDQRLIDTARESMMQAIQACKPGFPYRNIGGIIEDVCQKNGFNITRNYTGHGCGDLFHTNPIIHHYKNNKAKGLMQVGHVFTIEPMVNVGKAENIIWPDEWTVCTVDGKKSAQFEHQIIITDTGAEILTGPSL